MTIHAYICQYKYMNEYGVTNQGPPIADDIDFQRVKTISAVYRELEKLYTRVKRHQISRENAIVLKEILSVMAKIKQDQRDNRYKLRLEALWREYQARLKAPRMGSQALVSSSVVDVTPPVQTAAPKQEQAPAQGPVPDKIND